MRLWLDAPAPALTAGRRGGTIWLDRSPALILAVCACGWRAPADTPARAWAAAALHAVAVHDDTAAADQARKNRGRLNSP